MLRSLLGYRQLISLIPLLIVKYNHQCSQKTNANGTAKAQLWRYVSTFLVFPITRCKNIPSTVRP